MNSSISSSNGVTFLLAVNNDDSLFKLAFELEHDDHLDDYGDVTRVIEISAGNEAGSAMVVKKPVPPLPAECVQINQQKLPV